jgi:hypothetical protein
MQPILAAFLAGLASGAIIVWLAVTICLQLLFRSACKRHILCRMCLKTPKCVKNPAA